jgi:hypothetical protein
MTVEESYGQQFSKTIYPDANRFLAHAAILINWFRPQTAREATNEIFGDAVLPF